MQIQIAGALLLALASTALSAYAQRCPEVGIFYVIRGEDGAPLSDAELSAVVEGLPGRIAVTDPTTGTGAARPLVSSIGTNDDGSLRQHSFGARSRPIPALLLYGTDCRMRLEQLTVDLKGMSMRLTFNVELDGRGVSMLVVDSLPFQEGSFALAPPRSTQTVVPAQQWTKVAP